MRLNHLGRVAADCDTFDDIGVKSPLREKLVTPMRAGPILAIFSEQFLRCLLKYLNELITDYLAFLLRIGHSAQEGEETFRGVNVFEFHVKILLEDPLHDFFFASAEQSVIDEDAGQLITNRFVQQGRDHRGIDSAAEAKYHLIVADLSPDTFTGVLDEGAHRPIHRATANVIDEIL